MTRSNTETRCAIARPLGSTLANRRHGRGIGDVVAKGWAQFCISGAWADAIRIRFPPNLPAQDGESVAERRTGFAKPCAGRCRCGAAILRRRSCRVLCDGRAGKENRRQLPGRAGRVGDCRKIGGRNHLRALNGVVPDVCRDCLVSDSGQHQLCFQWIKPESEMSPRLSGRLLCVSSMHGFHSRRLETLRPPILRQSPKR